MSRLLKICPTCKSANSISLGIRSTKTSTYRRWVCKDCGKSDKETTIRKLPDALSKNHAEAALNWRKKNRGYAKKRREAAAGRPYPAKCECCHKEDKDLMWDHDHVSGNFRGYICRNCNTALGFVGDSVAHLEKLILYINRFKNMVVCNE